MFAKDKGNCLPQASSTLFLRKITLRNLAAMNFVALEASGGRPPKTAGQICASFIGRLAR
jgi:hypothetical protein